IALSSSGRYSSRQQRLATSHANRLIVSDLLSLRERLRCLLKAAETRRKRLGRNFRRYAAKILSEPSRVRLLQFTFVGSRRYLCRPQRLPRRPRLRRKQRRHLLA